MHRHHPKAIQGWCDLFDPIATIVTALITYGHSLYLAIDSVSALRVECSFSHEHNVNTKIGVP